MTSRSRAALAALTLAACGAPAAHDTAPIPAPAPARSPAAPASGMTGVVVDDRGAPIAHARVEAWVSGPGGAQARTTTDAQGRFALDLPPGSYSVRADTDAGYVGPIAVTVDPGGRAYGVTLQLPPDTSGGIGNFF